jgi:hypothetical protein
LELEQVSASLDEVDQRKRRQQNDPNFVTREHATKREGEATAGAKGSKRIKEITGKRERNRRIQPVLGCRPRNAKRARPPHQGLGMRTETIEEN